MLVLKIIIAAVVLINVFLAGMYHEENFRSCYTKKEYSLHGFILLLYMLLAVEIGFVIVLIEFFKFLWKIFNYYTHITFRYQMWKGKFDDVFTDEERNRNLSNTAKQYARYNYAGMKPTLSARHDLYCLDKIFNKHGKKMPVLLGGCNECFSHIFDIEEVGDKTNVYRCDNCGVTQFLPLLPLHVNANGRLVVEDKHYEAARAKGPEPEVSE